MALKEIKVGMTETAKTINDNFKYIAGNDIPPSKATVNAPFSNASGATSFPMYMVKNGILYVQAVGIINSSATVSGYNDFLTLPELPTNYPRQDGMVKFVSSTNVFQSAYRAVLTGNKISVWTQAAIAANTAFCNDILVFPLGLGES